MKGSFIYEILAGLELIVIVLLVVFAEFSLFLRGTLLIAGAIGFSYLIQEVKQKTINEYNEEIKEI